MWALQAKAREHRRHWEHASAAAWFHYDQRDQEGYANRHQTLASGPGIVVPWVETLTPAQRAGLAEAEREQAETIETLKRRGIPVDLTVDSSKVAGRFATS
jgi:hypothetical protein